MSSPGFETTETERAIVVRFLDSQILNDHKMEVMAEELFRLADRATRRDLRLDFGVVEYVQSSVLGKLVSLHKKLSEAGSRLVLCNISPAAYRAFTVTKLDKLFVVEPPKTAEKP